MLRFPNIFGMLRLLTFGLAAAEAVSGAEPLAARRTDRPIPLATSDSLQGTLRMRFVATGAAVEGPVLTLAGTASAGPKGVRDVVVWVRRVSSARDGDRLEGEGVVELVARDHRFVPHLLPVMTGRTLRIRNEDATPHIALIRPARGPERNVFLAPGEETTWRFDYAEPSPVRLSCTFHSSMRAYLLVVDNPHVGVSDENGLVELSDVPAAQELTLRMWHEGTPPGAPWVEHLKVVVPPGGVLDLGDVFVPAARRPRATDRAALREPW
jgi:plastocyanin